MQLSRPFLLLMCLSALPLLLLLPATASSQPRHDKPQPGRLYQVFRYDKPYQRKIGFIDRTGKLVIDFERLPKTTKHVREFHEGLAVILLENNGYENTIMGYINRTGEMVIAPRFDYARDFNEGLAYVESKDFRGFIDHQGKIVFKIDHLAPHFKVEVESLGAKDFHEGLAAVGTGRWDGYRLSSDDSSRWQGLWGYIDHSGKLVVRPEYQFADNFSEGLAGVVIERKYGFINKEGRMVVPPRFEPRLGGPHAFGIGGTSYFLEGLACVKAEDGLYGYINQKGDYVFPQRFHQAMDFSEGVAWVLTRDEKTRAVTKVGWIDKAGRWVAQEKGRDLSEFSPLKYSEGLVPFSVSVPPGGGFLWGYMDHRGAQVIKPAFSGASSFIDGVASVSLYEKSSYVEGINTGYFDRQTGQFMEIVYGYIDRQGHFIWKSK